MPLANDTSHVDQPENQAHEYRKSAARLQALEALEREFEAFVKASKQTLALTNSLPQQPR